MAAKRYTDQDKARVLTALAANDDNVKRTARDTGIDPSTIRYWRRKAAQGSGPDPATMQVAVTEFVDDAVRVRNKALAQLEVKLDAGELNPAQLITALGVLDDKVNRVKVAQVNVNHNHTGLPSAEELRGLLVPWAEAGMAAARAREIIVDAEVVEDAALALPPGP